MENPRNKARGDIMMGKNVYMYTEKCNTRCLPFLCRSSEGEHPHFVRGEKQYIYDDQGRKYLDILNSVQHGRRGYSVTVWLPDPIQV